jgi:Putative zincin peptidase
MKHTIYYTFKEVNSKSLLFVLPVIFIKMYLYFSFIGANKIFENQKLRFFFSKNSETMILLMILLILIFGFIFHELIHYATLKLYKSDGIETVSLGFSKEFFVPYTTFIGKIQICHFMVAVIAPYIILGLIPFILSLVYENIWLFLFSIFFTGAAAGDFFILYKIRSENKLNYVSFLENQKGMEIKD